MNWPEVELKKRRPDWDVRLVDWADAQVGRPFEWNETNCAALAAAAIDAMFGTTLFDWQANHRLTDARALALSVAGKTRETLLYIGCKQVDPPYAQRGDILLAIDNEMECSHISLGLNSISSSPENGVHLVSTESVVLNAAALEVFRCP